MKETYDVHPTNYCLQCTREHFGGANSSNLAHQITREQHNSGLVVKAECNSCGLTYVDHAGKCVSKDCTKQHGRY